MQFGLVYTNFQASVQGYQPNHIDCPVLIPAISWGEGFFPPRIPNPLPQKIPQNMQKLKNTSNIPPRYVISLPQNTESRIHTVDCRIANIMISMSGDRRLSRSIDEADLIILHRPSYSTLPAKQRWNEYHAQTNGSTTDSPYLRLKWIG